VGCCICQVKMGGCGGNSVFDRTDPRSILSVRWYTHRWYSQWWLSSFGFGCAILVAVKYPLSHPIEYWSIYIVSWYVSIYICRYIYTYIHIPSAIQRYWKYVENIPNKHAPEMLDLAHDPNASRNIDIIQTVSGWISQFPIGTMSGNRLKCP
jgi:hypothetical protein